MNLLLVTASTSGFNEPSENDSRTCHLLDILQHTARDIRMVMVPAGYWTAQNSDAMRGVLADLWDTLGAELRKRNVVLLGGIDALPIPPEKRVTPLVKAKTLPFWGFALNVCGEPVVPWRQVSTTGDNSTIAPPSAIATIADRRFVLGDRIVLPIMCGEMHSEPVRCEARRIAPTVIVVTGHASLGQGLAGSLQAMHGRTGAAVLHVRTRSAKHIETARRAA